MNFKQANVGVIPPVPTILDEHRKFDRNAMKILIDSLINKGVHGLFFLGTGGEFSQFSTEEREDIAEFCIDYTNGRLPVWIGTGSNNTTETIRLTKHAAQSGTTGVIVINPFYSKLSEETLFAHYAAILEATEIPVMLYNFPALTGQDLSPAFVSRLAARYSHLVGIKETVDQLSHIRQMILEVKEINPAFSVFSGFDEYLLPTLAAGGAGAISASANFAPQLLLGVYSSFQNNNLAELLEHQRKVIEIPAIYSLDEPFILTVKEAIRMTGVPIPTFCLPPSNIWDAQKEQKLKEILTRAGVPLAE
ncbi:dihydrodipicolinate synthase family protein [Paenibacillus sp. 19GGS1-52]|uniref:dihydrodipicolinate synthase family protein n=1 Tax=Paenibacillus sp. 19GGS1-52 TaxID=2758563 RepID=UPI001EFA49F2|nr:dihydrodipicolinate synthase family protein [Paenibacillus sp. 19GGS1-52]ULO09029.1 dihydrodipicolinate synthase family protein [Paenibacillus sp. 19GGS1-52]